MKNVICFKNIAELKSYMIKNHLELSKEIPPEIIKDDRNSQINLVLNVNGEKEFNLSTNINNNPPFVIISDAYQCPIDCIDLINIKN